MDRILVILIGWPVAFLILKYRRPVKEFIGNVGFAEKFLGTGGTNTLVVIIGFLVFIFSLMYAVGTFDGFLQGTFGRFFQ